MSQEFYSETIVTARKEHNCEICNHTIVKGEKYYRKAGRDCDYGFYSSKECAECQPIIDEFFSEGAEDGYNYESIYDYWREYKCYNCKNHFPICKPDEYCKFPDVEHCREKVNGRCICGDTCDEMTRGSWCENFIKKEVI